LFVKAAHKATEWREVNASQIGKNYKQQLVFSPGASHNEGKYIIVYCFAKKTKNINPIITH
jgi:hypothetical protein